MMLFDTKTVQENKLIKITKKCILFAYHNHDKLRMLILNPESYSFGFNITYKLIAIEDGKALCTPLV